MVAAAWSPSALTQEETPAFKVVVHSTNPLETLPRAMVAQMFLHRVRRWEFNDPLRENPLVEVVEQPEGAPLRESFARFVHRRPSSSLKRYWMRQIFSGRGRKPTTRDTDREILAFVRDRTGAIGYVSVDTPLPSGTKELGIEYGPR
jgi:ABC-type phosphate transport system substrate-binding protein